ncbi:hypothetical protein BDZ97DRAFT_1912806 [Flammula alnicola]|nr:hypothetical protein BDZ97DRAFT_1912806 [Flammula alnicola]
MANSSTNSPDISASGSRLLSLESPLLASDTSSSRTGPGGDDLSLSELSLSDHTAIMRKPFSLLAKVEADLTTPTRNRKAENTEVHAADDVKNDRASLNDVTLEDTGKQVAKLREEKLQSDIFILKKLNASFEKFNEALQETGSANQRVAAQLEQTDALLNKYIDILSKSEDFSRLIFDEQWQGAEADEEALEQEILIAKERARREAEEQALRAQQEAIRLEREKQEELRREEKERVEREKSERAIRSGRGVRGTRASMRGMRGAAPPRTDPTAGVPRGIPRRPPSASARPSAGGPTRGSSRPT